MRMVRVAHVAVELHEVVAELAEEAGLGGIAGKEVGHVVRRASHQAEGQLGPLFRGDALGAQVGMRARDLPAAPGRPATVVRDERHRVAVLGGGGEVEESRDRVRAAAEGSMLGDVRHPFAVDVYVARLVSQVRYEVGAGPQSRGSHGLIILSSSIRRGE